MRKGEGVELDRNRVADMHKPALAAQDVRLDLERRVGRHQRQEMLPRLQNGADRHLSHRLDDSVVLGAQFNQFPAQFGLAELLARVGELAGSQGELLRHVSLPRPNKRIPLRHGTRSFLLSPLLGLLGIGQ